MRIIHHKASKLVLLLAGAALLFSCNDYLDKMPDNRTEIDSPEKITQLLVSAYSETLPIAIQELMSDNVTDYGRNIDIYDNLFEEAYLFKDITDNSFDTPDWIWEHNYHAIATANLALKSIAQLGLEEELAPQRGEALIARAYAHFTLCNAFCQAYNPETSGADLGIPYVDEPEESVFVDRKRGTVAEVYEKIAADIEEGLPLIDDVIYAQPKFHFNKRAANAFAAQFYLYYGKYEQAVACATAAIGEDPTALFRNWDLFTGTSVEEYTYAYISSEEPANLFCQGARSMSQRYRGGRYIMTDAIRSQSFQSGGPWGASLPAYEVAFSYASRAYIFPKIDELFMISDPVQQIGQPYVVEMVYTTEKTILDRAEAYAMLKDYDAAARDLTYFYRQGGADITRSAQQIFDYYEGEGSIYCKPLAPRFAIEEGMQADLVQACIHARRIVTVHEGSRLHDLKRFGIAYTHVCDGAANIEIEPYDKRLAIQLPTSITSAGMEANPR